MPDLSEFREIERAVEQANTGPVEGIETHPEDNADTADAASGEPAEPTPDTSDDDKTTH